MLVIIINSQAKAWWIKSNLQAKETASHSLLYRDYWDSYLLEDNLSLPGKVCIKEKKKKKLLNIVLKFTLYKFRTICTQLAGIKLKEHKNCKLTSAELVLYNLSYHLAKNPCWKEKNKWIMKIQLEFTEICSTEKKHCWYFYL